MRLPSAHIIAKSSSGRDIITFGENVYYSHNQQKGIYIGNMYSNAIYSMLHNSPLIPVYNKDGELFDYDDLIAQGIHTDQYPNGMLSLNQYYGNPLNTLLHSAQANNKSRSHNLNATGYITISPLKGLTYKGLVYYKNWSSVWKGYEQTYRNNDNDQNTNDVLSENMGTGWNWGMTHTLNYVFDVKEHHIDVLAGTE